MDDTTIINQLFEKYHNNDNIYIKNEEKFKEKIKKLINEGRKSIQVISDFDMTITKYWHEGKRTPTSHRIVSLIHCLIKMLSNVLKIYLINTIPMKSVLKSLTKKNINIWLNGGLNNIVLL